MVNENPVCKDNIHCMYENDLKETEKKKQVNIYLTFNRL